jgi:hypothetical protein
MAKRPKEGLSIKMRLKARLNTGEQLGDQCYVTLSSQFYNRFLLILYKIKLYFGLISRLISL